MQLYFVLISVVFTLIFGFNNLFGQQIQNNSSKDHFFSEAENMAWFERQPIVRDSIKRVYQKKWIIGFNYGRRSVNATNFSLSPDTLTYTDFSKNKSFWSLEGGYFINDKFQIPISIDFLFLPKKQEFSSVTLNGPNGIQVEGTGSGGLMIKTGVGLKYFLNKGLTRPYVGFEMGNIKAIAKGGDGGFSSSSGQYQRTEELKRQYKFLEIVLGFNHRLATKSMFDFNISYLNTSKSENIGGILSPGGFNLSLGIHLLINKN